MKTKSQIFKAAHQLAKSFTGNYSACFALALTDVYASINQPKMKTTRTFTVEHIAELERIVKLNVFASKIAATILSKDFYSASAKQVDILNEVSEITFYVSDGYSNKYMETAQQRQKQLMYA